MKFSAIGGFFSSLGVYRWLETIFHAATPKWMAMMSLVLLSNLGGATAASDVPRASAEGRGQFIFSQWSGPPLPIWYQLPDTIMPDTRIVIVMHGVNRDADRYRDEWASLARDNRFIVIAPQFSEADFPGSRGYNTGFFTEADASPRLQNLWSFAAIEPLFDETRRRFGTLVPRYTLYGHSAGGQFVHRFVMAMPEARLEWAISANAGWYTMPDPTMAFPYGVGGSPISLEHLKTALAKPLVVLLGTADIDPCDPNLRRTPEANQQGPHRYARGERFFSAGKAVATQLDVPFAWIREDVVGVGHQNHLMAEAATRFLKQKIDLRLPATAAVGSVSSE
jgi:poly(3-hydroxybutyrate) depolymerase